jgi:hypothetical protein
MSSLNFFFGVAITISPMRYELKEGESHTFYIELIKQRDYFIINDVTLKALFSKTRLGLILINDVYDQKIIMDPSERMNDKSKWTGIIWSNIINL